MIQANLVYLINFVIFIYYLVLHSHRTMWPDEFLIYVWIPYILHVYLHHFFDGFQNTTRNIARIYLIQNNGPHYDNRLIEPIQHALISNSMLPVTILWQLIHVFSFSLLLFMQGWGIALIAEFGLMLLGGIIPLGYQSHLRRIHKQVKSLDSTITFRLLSAGINLDRLFTIIDQAIQEKRNPQQWWATVLRNALKEEVTNNSEKSEEI